MEQHVQARRSILAVPAGRPEMVQKAQILGADQIFFDLEDGTAPSTRKNARANIAQALRGRKRGFISSLVSIRVNQIGTSDFDADMILLSAGSGLAIDSIFVPKVHSLRDLEEVDSELQVIENNLSLLSGSIGIEAQIESAQGLVNVNEIATFPRVSSLSFGPLDFLADLGVPTLNIDGLHPELTSHALATILIATRAAGKLAFDGPCVEYKNLEIFEKSAKSVYKMGFDGKWLIHPNQIVPCHAIFTPTHAEFALALEMLDDYNGAINSGIGAIESAESMIDAASIRMALVIKARGIAAGMLA